MLVIVGSTTTRMASNYGYNTFIVFHATAAFDKVGAEGQKYLAQVIHETALASLHNELAKVINTKELLRKLGN
jgi:replicative DNA helicase